MTDFASVPLWLAVLVAFFVMLGATLTLIGALGFVRLERFYDRLHAPTLGTSWGTCGVIVASMLLASHFQERLILHEILIGMGVLTTVPVTLMLLGRAALHRDRIEGHSDLAPILRVGYDGRAQEVNEVDLPDEEDVAGQVTSDDDSEDYTPGDDYPATEDTARDDGALDTDMPDLGLPDRDVQIEAKDRSAT